MKVWGILNLALLGILTIIGINGLFTTRNEGFTVSIGMLALSTLEIFLLVWYIFFVRRPIIQSVLDAQSLESGPILIPTKYQVSASILSVLLGVLGLAIIGTLIYLDQTKQSKITENLREQQFRFFMLFKALFFLSLVFYNLRSAFRKNQHVPVTMLE